MADIPKRAVTRTAKLATLPLGVAGRATLGLGKRLGGKPAEAVAAELQERTAQQIFKVLGELKGGAMKFGQALSVFEAALPEDVAAPYRVALTKLQEAGPPMPAATVHKVLAEELGADWRSRFSSFDDVPAASASIGQVHRAVWADGREVAVKIQYPGAGPALMSDLTQLTRLARMLAAISPGLDVKPLLREMQARVSEELDYRLEGAVAARLRRGLRRRPRLLRPEDAVHRRTHAGDRMDGRHAAVGGHPGGHRASNATGPGCCWCGSCIRARPGSGCCTPTRTPATSGCCRTAGSGSSTSARSTGCRTGYPNRSAGWPGWRSPATPKRCSTGCGTRDSSGPACRSTRRSSSTTSGRCSTRSASRNSPSPGPGCARRRYGSAIRARRRRNSAGS